MKKFTLVLVLATFSLLVMAQQVARDKVIMEIATGTWCQYCPGAAMGADDLIANGCEVAVIEYHEGGGDPFENSFGVARNTYNNAGGFPTATSDGVLDYAGGSNTTSMYTTYLPMYQQRIVIDCDFTVDIYGQLVSGTTYDLVIEVENVNDVPFPSSLSTLIFHLC